MHKCRPFLSSNYLDFEGLFPWDVRTAQARQNLSILPSPACFAPGHVKILEDAENRRFLSAPPSPLGSVSSCHVCEDANSTQFQRTP